MEDRSGETAMAEIQEFDLEIAFLHNFSSRNGFPVRYFTSGEKQIAIVQNDKKILRFAIYKSIFHVIFYFNTESNYPGQVKSHMSFNAEKKEKKQ